MSDEAAFLKAIANNPGERATRLAYADWLEENGRPREAEFLKAQLQVAELNAKLIELGAQLNSGWLTAIENVRTEPLWLDLRSGRQIRLVGLRQWNFYRGLLAGVPTSQENSEGVQRLVADEQLRRGELPYLVPPVEKPVERPASAHRGPLGLLPSVACVGEFESFDPARDTNAHASQLTVIWFQHELAFPIDPGVRELIRAIDWNALAHDFYW